jgi:RNA polymerase sigma-70 factor (family 1)
VRTDYAEPSPETELVNRLKTGDVDAFDEIYRIYAARLFSFGLRYLKSREDTEELVQSVFLKLWESRESLIAESPVKSFLFTIAYNKICNIFRKKRYHREFLAEVLRSESQASADLQTSIEIRFFLDRVYELVDQLPEKQREAFLKSRKEGKSSKEIAEELGLSSGSVDNYNADTLRLIRTYLKHEGLAVILCMSFFSDF